MGSFAGAAAPGVLAALLGEAGVAGVAAAFGSFGAGAPTAAAGFGPEAFGAGSKPSWPANAIPFEKSHMFLILPAFSFVTM